MGPITELSRKHDSSPVMNKMMHIFFILENIEFHLLVNILVSFDIAIKKILHCGQTLLFKQIVKRIYDSLFLIFERWTETYLRSINEGPVLN